MVSQSSRESRAPPRKVLQNASVFPRHLETANQETADDKSPRVCLGHWNRRSFSGIQVCAGKRRRVGSSSSSQFLDAVNGGQYGNGLEKVPDMDAGCVANATLVSARTQ